MDCTYLGLSSFKLTGKNASLVFDPFDPKSVGIKFPKTFADIVTVSHPHQDHNYTDGVASSQEGQSPKIVNGPGEYEIKGISILGYPSGENTIYVVEIDGFRVAHLGNLAQVLTEEQITELGEIDILMVPVGGQETIDGKQAASLVQSIEPKYAIPMHYKTDSLSTVDDFLTAIGVTPENSKKLSLKPGAEFASELKVLILEA